MELDTYENFRLTLYNIISYEDVKRKIKNPFLRIKANSMFLGFFVIENDRQSCLDISMKSIIKI